MNTLLLLALIILGPGDTTVRYREDYPGFMGPLAARPRIVTHRWRVQP